MEHLIRPLRGHLPLKGKAFGLCLISDYDKRSAGFAFKSKPAISPRMRW